MADLCPSCGRGTIQPLVEGPTCDRCLVVVPASSLRVLPEYVRGRRPRYRPDQDTVGKYTDYARTKADK